MSETEDGFTEVSVDDSDDPTKQALFEFDVDLEPPLPPATAISNENFEDFAKDYQLDRHPLTRPAWLKLVRDGTAYTAYASSDGTAWQQVATATVPSASGTGDAGLVASAVNLNYPGQITTALFDSFSAQE